MAKTYLSPERAERMKRHADALRWGTKKRASRLAAGIRTTDPIYEAWSKAYDAKHPKPEEDA